LGIVDRAKRTRQHEEVTNLQDVIEAWNGIEEAWERYRETVRAAMSDGVTQTSIATAIDRTRESIRRDAMPTEQRQALEASERERLRKRRSQGK
jgi:hypothetical protein